jgi:hypothetical protein
MASWSEVIDAGLAFVAVKRALAAATRALSTREIALRTNLPEAKISLALDDLEARQIVYSPNRGSCRAGQPTWSLLWQPRMGWKKKNPTVS